MEFSDNKELILPALLKAKGLFVKAKKDKQNTHLKNKYATLDSFFDAIDSALEACNLMVMQDMVKRDEARINTMELETMVVHESGQFIKGYTSLPIQKNDPQGVGSVMTYARRYGLAALLGISQADDDAQSAMKSAKDWKRDMDLCENAEMLKEIFALAYRANLGDAGTKVVTSHYNELKAKFEIGTAKGFTPAKPKENVKQEPAPAPEPTEPEEISNF